MEVVSRVEKIVLSVHLLHEKTREPYLLFGAIVITAFKIHTLTVRECRNILKLQLSGLPHAFRICTADKCPLREDQEDLLLLSDIIKTEHKLFIIRDFDKPKCGIVVNNGDSVSNMGFIFTDYNCMLTDLRSKVTEKLEDKGYREDFEFLDVNGWPVHKDDENRLLTVDVLNESVIVVQNKRERRNSILSCDLNSSLNLFHKKRKWAEMESEDIPPLSHDDSSASYLEQSLNVCNKSNGLSESKNQTPKQILISYCRAEAARHAVALKEELSNLGFTVYLDVHEIKSGNDWQDSLNYAVSNCEVFVPLVTPRYGQTQWTNREVKLADILGKIILPVSFISEWPPRCLAIQFATTQFIRWKTTAQIQTEIAEGKEETCRDISMWEHKYIVYVASDIGERITTMRKQLLFNLGSFPSLVKRKTVVRSLAAKVQTEILTDTHAVTEDREGRPLILICLHPEQSDLGTSIKDHFEGEKYEVCLTLDLESWETETVPATPTLSQDVFSQMAFDAGDGNKDDVMEKQRFQEKADEANVILAVLSAAFSKSTTCKQQLFYCEHRKRVLFIKLEDFRVPGWMKMLIGSSAVENAQNTDFFTSLERRLCKVLDPEDRESPQEEIDHARINTAVQSLKKNLPTEFSIYVCGCQDIRDQRIKAICRILGEQLASFENLTLITGGCDGVEEIISGVFHEKLIATPKKNRLWHVMPMRGLKPRKSDSSQNSTNSSFSSLPFGKTLFCGGSPKERDLIVSQAFDMSIIVEGDASTICTAEQFIWNDHIVIPVQCFEKSIWDTGSIQEKAFQIPQGISETDWAELNCLDSTPEIICDSVIRILKTLMERQEKLQEKTRLVTRVQSVPNDYEKALLKTEPTLRPILKKLQPESRRSSLSTMRTVLLK